MSLDVYLTAVRRTVVYECNYTHNIGAMADKAGVYVYLWRAPENDVRTAGQLIEPLSKGIEDMKSRPGYYQTFNPENGWGDYHTFLRWLESLLAACRENPDAELSTSR